MKIDERTLKKGLEFTVLSNEKFKTEVLVVNFQMPKTEKNIAVGNLLAKMISRGTKKHENTLKINRYLAGLYSASLNVSHIALPASLCLRISCSFLDERYLPCGDTVSVLSGVIALIKEMLECPLVNDSGEWNAEYMESEKNNLLDELRAQKNSKDSYAMLRLNEIWYEGYSLALNPGGTESGILAVTSADLSEYLDAVKKSAPVTLVYAGNFTAEKEKKCLELTDYLSNLRAGGKATDIDRSPEIPDIIEFKNVTEETDAKQSRMLLGYGVDKSKTNMYARMVFSEIFGGSPVSRLFTNVRERMSLCYYCQSIYRESIGKLTVRSGLDAENRDKAAKETERQLGLLCDSGNITETELEAAKKSLINNYKSIKDGNGQYASWYLGAKLGGLDTDIDGYIGGISEVTAVQVADVAKSVRPEISYLLVGAAKE